jgi:hypothetical protein
MLHTRQVIAAECGPLGNLEATDMQDECRVAFTYSP